MLGRMRYRICGILAAVAALASAGCSFGIKTENLLQPPRPAGEYEEIQAAVKTYLSASVKDDSMTLKYPKTGTYRSAFILKDVDGDGEEEAFVLYQQGVGLTVHLHVLKKNSGNWQTLADFEGAGEDVDRIGFADLHGYGYPRNVLVGWSTGVLTMYEMMNGAIGAIEQTWQYTDWTVGNFRGMDRDDLLILYIEKGDAPEQKTSASLWNFTSDDSLREFDTILLDSGIRSFSSVTVVPLPTGANGQKCVYIDAVKEKFMLTELIYWEQSAAENSSAGGSLVAPFCVNGTTEMTLREGVVPSRAITTSNVISWPDIQTPKSQTNGAVVSPDAGTEIPVTVWKHWNFEKKEPDAGVVYAFMNWQDGYYVLIEQESYTRDVICLYAEDTRTLSLRKWADLSVGPTYMTIRVLERNPDAAQPTQPAESSGQYRRLTLHSELELEVWISPSEDFSAIELSKIILPI